jgi:hypothetical protein
MYTRTFIVLASWILVAEQTCCSPLIILPDMFGHPGDFNVFKVLVLLLQEITNTRFEFVIVVGPDGLAVGATCNELYVNSRHHFFPLLFGQLRLLI